MIIKLETTKAVKEALTNTGVSKIFFSSPEMLYTFFNNPNFSLYSVVYKGKTYLFIQKEKTEELRLLFTLFPEALVEILKKEFDPPYIAYNELIENPKIEEPIESVEVTVDLQKFLSLENASLRKKYRQAEKYNNVSFVPFETIGKTDLLQFWVTWNEQRLLRKPDAVDRTYNDKRFFDIFSERDYFGVAAYDKKGILVAYSIGIGISKEGCISAFNKCLRGYRNLGLQVSYKKVQVAAAKGFSEMNLATINNDFKKHFLPISETQTIYSVELWRKETFTTKTPNGYTRALFW